MRCAVCHGESYSQNDSGDFICELCGTQSQDTVNEEVEYEPANLAKSGRGNVIMRYKKKGKRKRAVDKETYRNLDVEICLEAFQWVINHHVSVQHDPPHILRILFRSPLLTNRLAANKCRVSLRPLVCTVLH